jgi:hypothetical protein
MKKLITYITISELDKQGCTVNQYGAKTKLVLDQADRKNWTKKMFEEVQRIHSQFAGHTPVKYEDVKESVIIFYQ